MKKIFKGLLAVALLMGGATLRAQTTGDRILGVYEAVEEGKESKVRFTRQADGTYQGQIFWLKVSTNADGSPKLDVKNPDPAKRKGRADQAVLVSGVRYNAQEQIWEGGTVYNPTNGKVYKCEVSFEDASTLRVKGMLGPFSRSVYWTKVE